MSHGRFNVANLTFHNGLAPPHGPGALQVLPTRRGGEWGRMDPRKSHGCSSISISISISFYIYLYIYMYVCVCVWGGFNYVYEYDKNQAYQDCPMCFVTLESYALLPHSSALREETCQETPPPNAGTSEAPSAVQSPSLRVSKDGCVRSNGCRAATEVAIAEAMRGVVPSRSVQSWSERRSKRWVDLGKPGGRMLVL